MTLLAPKRRLKLPGHPPLVIPGSRRHFIAPGAASSLLLAGGFPVGAANFDGVNDYMTRGADFTGNTDTKLALISFWFRNTAIGGYFYNGGSNSYVQMTGASVAPYFLLRNSVAGTVALLYSDTAYNDGNWHHVAIAVDAVNSVASYYVDGANHKNAGSTIANDTIDWTQTQHTFGAADGGGSRIATDWAELYFNTQEYLDITVAANLQKFRGTNGKPVNLGATGSLPTGTDPIGFFRVAAGAAASTFATNLGTGGNLTITGALTSSTSSPSD